MDSKETVLVVDDNALIRGLIIEILTSEGFVVVEAESGPSALKISASHVGRIDLMIASVNMSKMSGPDLGVAIQKLRPEMRVLLTAAMFSGGLLVLNYGWAMLEKPFLKSKLLEMINRVLHNPDISQGSLGFDTGCISTTIPKEPSRDAK